MMPRVEAVVHSSHGKIYIDPVTGSVNSVELYDPEADDLDGIYAFDMAEFYAHYKYEKPGTVLSFDILDLGYSYFKNGKLEYEEPAHDWREELKDLRAGKEL
jgi:hypothetical protein